MEACNIPYIPERLHTNDKPDIPVFELGEHLYYRCKPEHLDQPFDGIKIFDLSVNRQGHKNNLLSNPEDVLFNINPENGKGELLDTAIITLEIIEISENNTYEKTINHEGEDGEGNPKTYSCFLKLLHDKLVCNYAHSIFKIKFEQETVTRDNWKITLGKKGKSVTELRTKCKLEFEEMIRNNEVRIN